MRLLPVNKEAVGKSGKRKIDFLDLAREGSSIRGGICLEGEGGRRNTDYMDRCAAPKRRLAGSGISRCSFAML